MKQITQKSLEELYSLAECLKAKTEKYKQKKIEEEKELNKKYEELKKEYKNLFES